MAEFDIETKNAMLAAIRNRIDAGPVAGTLTIYEGEQGKGRPLGTLTFSRPCAADPVNGVLTFDAITAAPMALLDSKATWGRIASGSGQRVMDTTVSGKAGPGEVKLNTTDIKAGGPIGVTALVLKF